MKPIAIMDVAFTFQPHAETCIIEERTQGELNSEFLQKLPAATPSREFILGAITEMRSRHITYKVPRIERMYSGSPGNDAEFDEFLDRSIAVVKAVLAIHQTGHCFGVFNPKRFWVGPEQATVILGLGLIQEAYAKEDISEYQKEDYHFLAPEFNSRNQINPDHRADFYGLGCLMHFWLTGSYFIEGKDRQEVLHKHLTQTYEKAVPDLLWMDTGICGVLGALLEKNPVYRYQSAHGVLRDLVQIKLDRSSKSPGGLRELSTQFNPGVIGSSHSFLEREEPLAELVEVYQEVREGASAVVFVEGAAGVGKTRLGSAFESAITASDVLYSKGGFDQSQATPYQAFQQAFQKVAQRILLKSGRSPAEIRKIFREGLGNDMSVLFEVIPDLMELTGKLPNPEELDPIETRDRFVSMFYRYCRTLDGLGLKRVLFIDDIQWSDLPSLELIEYLARAPVSRVMFVLSYNPAGMTENHPVRKLQQELVKAQKGAKILRLEPLSRSATAHLVAESLSSAPGDIEDLSNLIYEKTLGNPHYINHFLLSMQKDGVLTYDAHLQQWQYILKQVRRQEVAENVLAVEEQLLMRQSFQAQIILKVAAFNKGKFQIPLLSTVCRYPEDLILLLLDVMSQSGLLTRFEEGPVPYAFNHKRIQHAAVHLKIPSFPYAPEEIHFQLAQYHLRTGGFEGSGELNQLVEHLLRSRDLLTRDTAAASIEFILRAGDLANDSNSPATARQYLQFAREVQERFDLRTCVYEVNVGLAKACYLLKSMESGHDFALQALEYAADRNERLEVFLLNMKFSEAYTLYEENLAEGHKALELLGSDLSAAGHTGIRTQIEREYEKFLKLIPNGPSDLADAGAGTNEADGYHMEILAHMCTSARRSDLDLYALIVLRAGCLLARNAPIESTPFVLIHLGSLLCYRYGSYQNGLDVGNLALELLNRTPNDRYYTKSMAMYHVLLSPYVHMHKSLENQLSRGIWHCIERGEQQGADYLLYARIRNQFLAGTDLRDVLNLCNQALDPVRSHSDTAFTTQIYLLRNKVNELLGNYSDGSLRSEAQINRILKACKNKAALATHHILTGWIYCLQGSFKAARDHFREHRDLMEYATSEPQVFRYRVLESIGELLAEKRPSAQTIKKVKARQQSLMGWADSLPETFRAEYRIVDLLLACKEEKFQDLSTRIEKVLHETSGEDQRGVRALLAGALSDALSGAEFAFMKTALKREANRLMMEWGVNHVDSRDAGTFAAASGKFLQRGIGFDAQSLVKATQAISAEVNLNRLVQQLLQIVMENAGADRGALILLQDGTASVAALLDSSEPQNNSFASSPLSDSRNLPVRLIDHVLTNKKELCIDDMAEYIAYKGEHQVQTTGSLLLLPLMKQSDLIGVLHIANRQVSGLFTKGEVEILRVVASQAAISITNSLLYEQAVTLNRQLASSQEELAQLNQVLEERIKERTRHLRHEIEMRKEAERDLLVAKNDADNANRSKSQFLANMSHEIRTPLNAIVGFSQILSNQSKSLNLTYSFRRYLNNIYQSAESLSEIINDILDLSKIEAGKMVLLREDMDLRQLFNSVFRIQSSIGKAKGVQLTYEVAPGTPRYIHSDRGKIKQILMNIVGNAIKFTPAEKRVSLYLGISDGVLVFTIQDEGIGILKKDLEKIFQPFTQADAGINRNFGGTGLGLTITRSLVEMLDGRMEVSSEVDKGTLFTIRIPYELATTSQTTITETLFASYRLPATCKILVVEDNPMNQEMIQALFAELGSEVLVARNGKEGIRMTQKFAPDIVFLDVHMPKLDGFETLERIRKFNTEVPVIGLSADAFKEHQDAALEAGFSAYLTKPVQLGQLVAQLRKYLPGTTSAKVRKLSLGKEEQELKFKILEDIRNLPIFETEKLVAAAARLSDVLPPEEFVRLEDAIYCGDDHALQEFIDQVSDVA